MCEHTVAKTYPGPNKMFDNGGWEYIEPPKTAEELLALKKLALENQKE
jgi:hypothetical protein